MFCRSFAFVALLIPALAFAAAPEDKKAATANPAVTDLGTLVVTATRTEQPRNTTSASVVVITRAEIERSGHTHVVDVLRGRAGIEVNDFFGDGSRPNVGLRGFGENASSNTLVLVDGRRLNNPDIAGADFNSIPLGTVERIEIIQGSAGALYGDQAVGGVINIITRRAKTTSGAVEISGGSFGLGGGRARAALVADPSLRFSLDAGARHADNYRAHNRIDRHDIGGRADYDWSDGGAFVELRHQNERLQLAGTLTQAQVNANRRQFQPGNPNDFNNAMTDVARLGLRQSLSTAWTLEGELTSRVVAGEGIISNAAFTQHRRVYGLTPRLHGTLPAWNGLRAQLTLGADLHATEYRFDLGGTAKNDQQTYEGYLQGVIPLVPDIGLTLALRYGEVRDHLRDPFTFVSTQSQSDEQIAHSAGAYWQALPELKLFARHDRGFRFAKPDEFFGAAFGMPLVAAQLKTQTGNSYEAGAEWSNPALKASLLLYRLELKNEIVFDPTTFSNINLAASTRDGAQLDLRYPLPGGLVFFGGYTHIDVKAKGGALNGKTIPLTAEHQGRAGLEWLPSLKGLSAFIEAQAYGERFFGGDFTNTLAPLPAYQVVNLGGGYRAVNGFSARARLNNLLNEKYSEFGFGFGAPTFFPSPEINFQVTLGYEFGNDQR